MNHLAAAGVFAALYPLGAFLLARCGVPWRGALHVGCSLALGAACWSVAMLALLMVGFFSPFALGVAGWLVTAASVAQHARALQARRVVGWSLAILVAAGLYSHFFAESALGGRDDGIYTAHAVQLLRSRNDHLTAPVSDALGVRTHGAYTNVQAFVFPGIYDTPSGWQWQFSAIPSLWIAQLTRAIGDAGLYRINGLWAAIAVVIFAGLLFELTSAMGVAWPAIAIFALNPAQIWVSRINLSEPLAQVLALAGIALSLVALERRNATAAAIAAFLFGAGTAVRLDLVVVVPALSGAWLMSTMLTPGSDAPQRRSWTVLCIGSVVTSAFGVLATYVSSPPYVAENASAMLAAFAVTAILLVLVALTRVWAGQRPRQVRNVAVVACRLFLALVVVAFAYAALIRPHIEPFALMNRPGSPVHGMRSHHEDSLVNLAAYLTWPVLLLSLLGVVVLLRRAVAEKPPVHHGVLLMISGGVLFLLLTFPGIAPDHFWAIRRFVPIAIPGAILLAAFGAQALLGVHASRSGLAVMLAVAAVTTMFVIQQTTIAVAENRGLTEQVQSIAHAVSGELVLVRDDALDWGPPLLARGERVLPMHVSSPYEPARDAALIRRECTREHQCRVLGDSTLDLAGLEVTEIRTERVKTRSIERTTSPLPHTAVVIDELVTMPRVAGLQPGHPRTAFAVPRDWRVAEGGMQPAEFSGPTPLRWTDGKAFVDIPFDASATTIEFRLHVQPQPDARLRLAVNDAVLFDGPVSAGEWTRAFPSPPADAAGIWRVAIESTTFVPAKLGVSQDHRTLGVGVRAIRVLSSSQRWLTAYSNAAAFRSRVIDLAPAGPVVVPPAGEARVQLQITNEGTESWATSPQSNAPVNLGIRWFSAADHAAVSEQRATLPYAIAPGESVFLIATLTAVSPSGQGLPPGDYEVLVGPVAEGVAWFYERGDTPLKIRARIVATSQGRG